MVKNKFNIILVLISLFAFSCTSKKEVPVKETILARIGDKTISKHEFIKRAEYTVRPGFLSGNSPVHKNIIFNSLVAEKLVALEYGDSSITRSEDFFLGRLEQAMRIYLFEKEATQKVKIDSNQINRLVKNSTKQFDVSYVSIADSNSAAQIQDSLFNYEKDFVELMQNNGLEEIPTRKVEWNFNEDSKILDSLFLKDREPGDLVGPIEISRNHYMFVLIDNVNEQKIFTDDFVSRRRNEIVDKVRLTKASEYYDHFIVDLMKEKSLEFNDEVFYQLVEVLGPVYLKNQSNKENMVKNLYWGSEERGDLPKTNKEKMELIKEEKLFEIDGNVWTVKDVSNYINKHPLVFRRKKMKNEEFGHEFQKAIIDLVTDYYVTQEAYQRGYDQVNVVKREYNIWKDNLNFVYQRNKILQSKKISGNLKSGKMNEIFSIMNPIVENLQKKFADEIELNIEELDKIDLTNINLEVIQPSEAYPKVVPGFPVVTDLHSLNYGNK